MGSLLVGSHQGLQTQSGKLKLSPVVGTFVSFWRTSPHRMLQHPVEKSSRWRGRVQGQTNLWLYPSSNPGLHREQNVRLQGLPGAWRCRAHAARRVIFPAPSCLPR